ncbi:hypothetical protein G9A89_013583 [Geosiphon pyriformis]|nr:hypothetical protein G9A89_013583 [Geosiphon pyriformis]
MKQDTTQAILFELVYGKTATLPVEIEVKTYSTKLITEENFQRTLLRKTYDLIETLENKQPEILLNPELDFITINQMRKITNTQFEELQNKITQDCLVKNLCKWVEHVKNYGLLPKGLLAIKLKKKIDRIAILGSYG